MALTSRPASGAAPASDPRPLPPASSIDLPESFSYRMKRRFLGTPYHTERLEHERLGKPTALAIFASDNLSSAAYASEEILRNLVPYVGLFAFSMVVPITVAMLVVLAFLILSYRETIKEYPSAGGAYVVTRDNFGIVPAQVAGASLLVDYTLTVAVSVSAGSIALASAFEALEPWRVPISIGFILLIAFGNLRGVRESGALFRVPTYFFMVMMVVLIGWGIAREVGGEGLPMYVPEEGALEIEEEHRDDIDADALFYGASLFAVLHAFASGGAAVTGVEAISNGVPAFRRPEWKNARQTLVIMGTSLGAMFLGLSWLASEMQVVPYEGGTPSVISQVGRTVFGEGDGAFGSTLYLLLQAGTMLILVLAANTAYADFPRLASFQASDGYMFRQLTKRGHRLVFSNGILVLSAAAIFLVVLTGAEVENLIPLYAVGVFTGFTLSQSGMVRHHLRRREAGWQRSIAINAIGALLSGIVLVIVAVTKFAEGAWAIVVLIPLMVLLLLRLNRQYRGEERALAADAVQAASDPILRRHVVLVFLNTLDRSTAAAIRYARTLTPDELRAVHIAVDPAEAASLARTWERLPLSRLALEVVECPDRRIERSALEIVARETADGETEVTVLLPRLVHRRWWHRLLHDRTSERIAEAVGRLPHANVTLVPFTMDGALSLPLTADFDPDRRPSSRTEA